MRLHHITDEMLRTAVDRQGSQFDTHDILRTLLFDFPHPYVLELDRSVQEQNGPIRDLFQHVHTAVGIRLATFKDRLHKRNQHDSENVRGILSPCGVWEKI